MVIVGKIVKTKYLYLFIFSSQFFRIGDFSIEDVHNLPSIVFSKKKFSLSVLFIRLPKNSTDMKRRLYLLEKCITFLFQTGFGIYF